MDYSNHILELVNGLESARQTVIESERKQTLLRGSPNDHDVTVESVMIASSGYHDTVAMLIVREMQLSDNKNASEKALNMQDMEVGKGYCKCFRCGKPGHIANLCKTPLTKGNAGQDLRKDSWKCFKWGKIGHIAKNCRYRAIEEETQHNTVMIVHSSAQKKIEDGSSDMKNCVKVTSARLSTEKRQKQLSGC